MLQRIRELQRRLREAQVDLALLMNSRDVFYYAGTAQPCNLLVPRDGDPLLQVRRAWDWVEEESTLPHACLTREAGFGKIDQVLADLPYPVRTLGVTMDAIPAKVYAKLCARFASTEVVDVAALIMGQRSVKDAEEIRALHASAQVFAAAHQVLLEQLRPGVTELELGADIARAIRRAGAETLTRIRRWDAPMPAEGWVAGSQTAWRVSGHAMTITGKGLSNSMAWGASRTPVRAGDLVVLDMGLNLHGYHADVARTYVVGRADTRQRELFGHVLELQETAKSAVRPGTTAEAVYFATRQRAEELGVAAWFQGHGDMQGSYIGHGLGLELDEEPTLMAGVKTQLEEHMVLALEPKLIVPQWGAIDLEDDVVVTADGCDWIPSVPRELFEVT